MKKITEGTKMYADMLKEMFKGISLVVEDMFLLDAFQIRNLEQYAPKKELAAVLHAYNDIYRFLSTKNPTIIPFITEIMREYGPAVNQEQLDESIDLVVWELGLMLISNKCPEEYDKRAIVRWDLNEIMSITPLNNKVVIDVGAGTGNVAFLLVKQADVVYAVEPSTGFREFMRKKAKKMSITNLFVMDGFLNNIPLPGDSVDVLITSNAIGWSLEEELVEIERVIKPGGYAIHLFMAPAESEITAIHQSLASSSWNYQYQDINSKEGLKRKYWKIISPS